ncbi:ATP-dependent DNA helicase [Trichonephila clavipes]|nr:ATP-dependent DNA helicase [Trichonephila clavipes]
MSRATKVARFNETFPQAELRRLEQAERDAAHRAAETPERSQARRRRQAEYLASQRAAETPEQSQARRLQHATHMASQRDTETIEAAESRKRAVAERAQQRRLIFTKTRGVFDKAAFEYDETLDYESHKLIKIEAMNKECRFCGALKWKEESAGMCCLGGVATILTGEAKGDNVLIPRIPIIPNNFPFNFKRLQFPLKVAFSMTINKSQGKTIKVAGLHFASPCFHTTALRGLLKGF